MPIMQWTCLFCKRTSLDRAEIERCEVLHNEIQESFKLTYASYSTSDKLATLEDPPAYMGFVNKKTSVVHIYKYHDNYKLEGFDNTAAARDWMYWHGKTIPKNAPVPPSEQSEERKLEV